MLSRARVAVRARWSLALASSVPALAFLYAGYERRWAGDDGFINLRVVSQLMDGNGFVFNAGERTEAVTSAGWVLLLWLFGELGANLDSAAWILGLGLSCLGLFMAARGAASISAAHDEPAASAGQATPTRAAVGDEPTSAGVGAEPAGTSAICVRGDDTLVLPFGVLAYAAIPVAWDYATSALENGIGLSFLGLAYWLMARVARGQARYHAAIGAFLGLAPLTRPDFALYAGPLGLVLLLATRGTRARLGVLLAAALTALGFQIFRMGYYAALVPNTAIAKEAFNARWDQGLLYLDNTFGAYQLAIPLALVTLGLVATLLPLVRDRQWLRASVPACLALSGALHILYVVRLGGDFMHGRMLLPGLFAIFAAGGVLRVRTQAKPVLVAALLAFAGVASWCVVCAHSLRPVMFANDILDERRWWSETAGEPHPTHLAHYRKHKFYLGPMAIKDMIAAGCPAGLASLGDDIGDHCKRVAWLDPIDGRLSDHSEDILLPLASDVAAPHVVAVYAFRPLGISGRAMGLRINLTDSFGLADPLAARSELTTRGRPGHEKVFSTVWFAAKYTAPGATQDPRVLTAKRALACGPLRKLHRATHEPLTVARFVKNIGLAFELHSLRVPSDPDEAVRRFCQG
jgi:arabinofuranosyltransferase